MNKTYCNMFLQENTRKSVSSMFNSMCFFVISEFVLTLG